MCRNPLDKKDIFLGSIFEPSQDDLDKIYAAVTGGNQSNKRMKYSPESSELMLEGGQLVSSSKGKVCNLAFSA